MTEKIIVQARIAGMFASESVVQEGPVELKSGATVKTFFQKADKALGFNKSKHFRLSLKQGRPPTVLINGDRLDLPEGFTRKLSPGDEITVLTPLAGG